MKDMERYRDGQEISWPLALAMGAAAGACVTLFHLELFIAGLIALGVLVLLGLAPVIVHPKRSLRTGHVVRVTSEADYPQSAHWRPFLPAIGIFAAGVGLEPTTVDPTVAVPAYFTAMTASSTWAFRRAGSESRCIGRRRAQAALEKADLAEATSFRLTVAEEHRGVLAGLVTLGAIDGIQVRLWKLAEVTGAGIDVLREKIAGLSRAGVVRTSAVDAGDDPSRGLVELTPVGVRVLHELRRR
ncbi:hypothetical protein [Corynebacterium halotolerans]|uniref:Uncharacterized protein n=1 Tax=Corynebacterium halotolerans YIM 70093 = DSM 44683 TaxID=1121362 RepID=M1MZQ2_9CORY|nr:hypothetical protein [Corynebacterium halotolerans]AGF73194.1 hypothetical protein A605_10970 [Corynebacterium halotolerans YIM 70093 = DSM 44683]